MTDSIAFLSESRSDCELSACGLTLNISRQRLTDTQYSELLVHAQEVGLLAQQTKMVRGDEVNATEHRQALHTSLRSDNPASPHYEEVERTRERM